MDNAFQEKLNESDADFCDLEKKDKLPGVITELTNFKKDLSTSTDKTRGQEHNERTEENAKEAALWMLAPPDLVIPDWMKNPH